MSSVDLTPRCPAHCQPVRKHGSYTKSRRTARQRQAGFSLVEVAIVTAIILLVAILGIPAIGTYVIENKVPKVGEALQRFAIRTKANAQGGGETPYAGVSTVALAHAVSESSVFDVSGTGSRRVVIHGLGGSGQGSNGVVTVAPVAVGGSGMGSGFALTLSNVSHAACPALASLMQGVATRMTLNSATGGLLLMDRDATPPVPYRAAHAASQCSQGDKNTFVFTVR